MSDNVAPITARTDADVERTASLKALRIVPPDESLSVPLEERPEEELNEEELRELLRRMRQVCMCICSAVQLLNQH